MWRAPIHDRPRRGTALAALTVAAALALSLIVPPAADAAPPLAQDGETSSTVAGGTVIDATASVTTIVQGDAVVIRYTLTDDGESIAGAPTTVHYAGRVKDVQTTAAGRGAISMRDLPVGKPVVIIRYAGDADHAPASTTLTFTVASRPASLTGLTPTAGAKVTGPSATAAFQLKSDGKPLAKALVAVTVRGTTAWVRTDADGRASYQVDALPVGRSTILVRYFGDIAHGRATASTSVVVTNPCPAAAKACIDLTNNVSWIQDGGKITYGPVPITSGMPGHRTRTGTFRVYWKDKNHRSSIFGGAPMPNSLFFDGGIAFHQGSLSDPSHGCIHLGGAASQEYWNRLGVGATVYVWGTAKY